MMNETKSETKEGAAPIADTALFSLNNNRAQASGASSDRPDRRAAERVAVRDRLFAQIAELEAVDQQLYVLIKASPMIATEWRRRLAEHWTQPKFVFGSSDPDTVALHRHALSAIRDEAIELEACQTARSMNAEKLTCAREQLAQVLAAMENSASTPL